MAIVTLDPSGLLAAARTRWGFCAPVDEPVEYQYDQLSRLISAATPGTGGWGLTFTYDGFGNKTNQTVSKGSAPVHSLSINPANNRIAMTGYGYDANGNLTTMPLLTASYDVANRRQRSATTR